VEVRAEAVVVYVDCVTEAGVIQSGFCARFMFVDDFLEEDFLKSLEQQPISARWWMFWEWWL